MTNPTQCRSQSDRYTPRACCLIRRQLCRWGNLLSATWLVSSPGPAAAHHQPWAGVLVYLLSFKFLGMLSLFTSWVVWASFLSQELFQFGGKRSKNRVGGSKLFSLAWERPFALCLLLLPSLCAICLWVHLALFSRYQLFWISAHLYAHALAWAPSQRLLPEMSHSIIDQMKTITKHLKMMDSQKKVIGKPGSLTLSCAGGEPSNWEAYSLDGYSPFLLLC